MNTSVNLNIEEFLADIWQQKPVVIKQGLPDFEDFIDEHELAGLAMEPELDSRLISKDNHKWQVSLGPFEEFESICKGKWTLLVQGVELAVDGAQQLLDEFLFLPSWRIDDLMVSFSVEGAGVGPHIDQYDVFIVQGKGKRRWQVGNKGNYSERVPHPNLRQIDPFSPIIDEVLVPGDIIYIPPGFPHNGIALEPCLNYSIGFRAPDQLQLLSAFTDHLIDTDKKFLRYSDKCIKPRIHPSEIKLHEIQRFQDLMLNALKDNDDIARWLLEYLSTSEAAHTQENATPYSEEQITDLINQTAAFVKMPGVKVIHLDEANISDKVMFAVNGQVYSYDGEQIDSLLNLLNMPEWTKNTKDNFKSGSLFVQVVTKLVNEGFWEVI